MIFRTIFKFLCFFVGCFSLCANVKELRFNLGVVDPIVDPVFTKKISIINDYGQSVKVESIESSCDCATVPVDENRFYQLGENIDFDLKWGLSGRTGPQSNSLIVRLSNGTELKLVLGLLCFVESFVDFDEGDPVVGRSNTLQFSIKLSKELHPLLAVKWLDLYVDGKKVLPENYDYNLSLDDSQNENFRWHVVKMSVSGLTLVRERSAFQFELSLANAEKIVREYEVKARRLLPLVKSNFIVGLNVVEGGIFEGRVNLATRYPKCEIVKVQPSNIEDVRISELRQISSFQYELLFHTSDSVVARNNGIIEFVAEMSNGYDDQLITIGMVVPED